MLTVLYIVIVFLLVFANGFFVASEFALVGVRRSRIQTLAESGSISARRLLTLIDNLNAYISATQLGITMAPLALGWIGEPVFAHILEAPLRGRVSDTAMVPGQCLCWGSWACSAGHRAGVRKLSRNTPALQFNIAT